MSEIIETLYEMEGVSKVSTNHWSVVLMIAY